MNKEQYVNLQSQENKFTPYYKNYIPVSAKNNIGEQPNILTSYNQTTKQTTRYDPMMSFAAVDAIWQLNQNVTAAKPITTSYMNQVVANQYNQDAINQMNFAKNVKGGVDILLTHQMPQIVMSNRPLENTLSSIQDLNLMPQGPGGYNTIGTNAFRGIVPSQSSGLNVMGSNGQCLTNNYSSQQYSTGTSPVQNLRTGISNYRKMAEYAVIPQLIPYIDGFQEFNGMQINDNEIIKYIPIKSMGINYRKLDKYINELMSQYQLHGQYSNFAHDYLIGVAMGKLSGIDITSVWEFNAYYANLPLGYRQQLQQAAQQILNQRNFASNF